MNTAAKMAEAFTTLDSMASSFNVYPLVLKYVKSQRAEIGSPRLLAYVIALFVVHGILLIQATLTLVLKITHRSKYGKLWFWRKQYLLDQTIPYLIPNGHFIIEPLQILGCIFFELLTVVIYIGVRWPDTVLKRPAYHETCLFWLAVAFVPGAYRDLQDLIQLAYLGTNVYLTPVPDVEASWVFGGADGVLFMLCKLS